VVTGAAPHLCRLIADKRYDGMIGEATAFDAKVIDNIT
jgi:hypothetical protein